MVFWINPLQGALIDVWSADDLNALDDTDLVGSWGSASNRTATAASGLQPILKKNATPAGTSVVRFTRDLMTVGNNPVGGRNAFSVAIVFKADTAGANDAANWYGKTGIVDAEEPGVTTDWGVVITEAGQVGIGTGSPDISTYSSGASLVNTNYHVGVFTWGGGSQAVYVDSRARVLQSGVSTALRNNVRLAFGGIATSEGGAVRRFNGDLAEIRVYNTALTATEASNVIAELTDKHILGNRPIIRSFAASTNLVLLSNSVSLTWNVTNATSVVIDNGVGPVAEPVGSVEVFPAATTTYTLTATNTLGSRSAQVTVMVDPGIPIAFSQSVTTMQNVAKSLTLTGTDPNGGTLTYSVPDQPEHGMLNGTPPDMTYTPMTGFVGNDAFSFKVNDGTYDSLPATVLVRVNSPPAPPTAIILSTTNLSENAGPGTFLAGLKSIDPNPEETHTYTLVPGFGDNALFTINGNQLLAGPAYAGGLGARFSIRIRDLDSGGFSHEQAFTLRVVEVAGNIVINEIHYNSPVNQFREEFIEIHNPTDTEADLSFWKLRGGVDFDFAEGTSIPARGFLVIAQDPATLLSRYGVTALGPWDGQLNNEGEELRLRDASDAVVDEVDFRSEFPWPIAANGEGPSMQLVNPSLDNDLGSSWRSGTPATPAATNSVYALNAAPNIRQVNHAPEQPASSNSIVITCKVTDPEGVASVELHYQVMAAGSFIPAFLPLTTAQLNALNTTPRTNSPNPAFEAPTNWINVAMRDDGRDGDELAGDSIYTVVIPQQSNRSLVRYRITCTDSLGVSRRAPFEDDSSLNFACFVYDGVPAYEGFSPEVLQSLPTYFLLTRNADMNQCTAWLNTGDQISNQTGTDGRRNLGRFHFNWEGAVVYDGIVYDHVHYRLRGANGRYHPGKRSFRIRFHDGHLLEAKDQNGNLFPKKWRELTTGKGQSNRGSETFALHEVINYFLWNKVGVPAPSTFHFHFRVIRGPQETPANRYDGDFWGLNWAQEKYDVNFLEARNLPKGNLYKLVDNFVLGLDELRYQAPFAPTNAADFFNIENNLTGFQSTEWLLAHVNYTNWYRYHAVAEAIRHYDIWPSANKNGAWYFEPTYTAQNGFLGRMMTLPYDSTDTWGPTWNGGQDVVHNGIFNDAAVSGGDTGENPESQKEYRNVVRELRDLLFQPDQIMPLIEAFARPLKDFAAADHVRWSNAPSPASYRSLGIPTSPGVTAGLMAVAEDLKRFMFVGGNNAWWIDRQSIGAGGWITRLDQLAADAAIPARPTITYVGPPGYPLDGLLLESSAFSDPQGSGTFAAMQWRVAEITLTNTAVGDPAQLRLEWDALWDSGELFAFNNQVRIPSYVTQPGRYYRARVRHKDSTGRWSRWSEPLQFIVTPSDVIGDLRAGLVISEIMYNPPGQGAVDGDQFEFLELMNTGTNVLDLSGLFFSSGINFTFTNGTLLQASEKFLLGRNASALQSRYPGLMVDGIYSGRLDNAGETITIRHPQGFDIVSVSYLDTAPWPLTADGFGFSLVLVDAASGSYRASTQSGGSPGANDPPSAISHVVINEVLTSSSPPDVDAIEIYNPTASAADLSGWYLTDDAEYPWKYRIANGTILPAGGYLVFTEVQFNPMPGLGASFAVSSLGDDVYLFSGNTNFQLTGYSHGFEFGGAATGISFGRHLNSVGDEQFPAQIVRSFGASNAGPRVGPVVISEIHYHPGADGDEFVELLNISGGPVTLYDPANPTNRWLINGLGYTFPPNATLGPNELLLVVGSDPGAFRAKYNVPASVAIFGPVSGNLQNDGERLELQAADMPTTNGAPYYAVDVVRYNDRLPWATAADGAGASLQRIVNAAYGNEPTNWAAAVATPGTLLPVGTRPVITTQPTNRTSVASQTAIFYVGALSAAPLFYQWRFNNELIAGETNSTLALGNVQASQAGDYTADVFNRFGSTTSAKATLTVLTPAIITQHPQSVTVRPGSNVTFTVAAVSRTPFRFQWRQNGVEVSGATNSMLNLSDVQAADRGAYTVIVTDAVGSVESDPAMLTVLIPPSILHQPLSQSMAPGATATFSVEVTNTGTMPFGFRWRRNGATIAFLIRSEVTSFYTVTNVNASTAGNYTVVVTNQAHPTGVLSATAALTVAVDSDSDGLPDDWESSNGLDPNNANDAGQDPDADAMTNWEEYIAGTDRTDGSSYLKVNRITASGYAVLEFGAVANTTYTVLFKTALDDAEWRKLGNVVARPTDRLESMIDPEPGSKRFYRLVTPARP